MLGTVVPFILTTFHHTHSQDFFSAAGSQGIKVSTIEKGLKQLKGVIGLYRETTGRALRVVPAIPWSCVAASALPFRRPNFYGP